MADLFASTDVGPSYFVFIVLLAVEFLDPHLCSGLHNGLIPLTLKLTVSNIFYYVPPICVLVYAMASFHRH
jgi:hypothetical protein